MCQRYYQKYISNLFLTSYGATSHSSYAASNVILPVTLRATPSIVIGTPSYVASVISYSPSADGFVILGTPSESTNGARVSGYTADAEL